MPAHRTLTNPCVSLLRRLVAGLLCWAAILSAMPALADGVALSEPLRLTPVAGQGGVLPDLAVDRFGRSHIVWQGADDFCLYYAQVGPDNQIQIAARKPYGDVATGLPQVAVDAVGNAHVITSTSSVPSVLVYVKIDGNDGSVDLSKAFTMFPSGTFASEDDRSPGIDINPLTDLPVVVAEVQASYDLAGIVRYRQDVSVISLDEYGEPRPETRWSAYLFFGSPDPIFRARNPRVTVDTFGNAHCVWTHTDPAWGGTSVAYSRSGHDNWFEISNARNVAPLSGGPDIARGPLGQVEIVWSTTANQAIWQKMDYDGATLVDDRVVSGSTAEASRPSVSANSGEVVFAWSDSRAMTDVYLRSIEDNFVEMNLSNSEGSGFNPSVVARSPTSVAAVWQDTRDGSSQIYYRVAGDPPPNLELSAHRVNRAELRAPVSGELDDPLDIDADRAKLVDQPPLGLGTVADGVTPVLLKFAAIAPDMETYSIEVWVDGQLMNSPGHLRVLQGSTFVETDTVSVTRDQPGYALLTGFRPEELPFGANRTEVLVTVKATSTSTSDREAVFFKIRKPPVVLVHGYNASADSWTFEFLKPLREERGLDFVVPIKYGVTEIPSGVLPLDPLVPAMALGANFRNTVGHLDDLAKELNKELETRIEDETSGLASKWSFTRYDVVGHSQGGVLLRMLCSEGAHEKTPAFKGPENPVGRFKYPSGRFRRVVTIGSPHNGSLLLYYVQKQRQSINAFDRAIPKILTGLFLVQSKFDPYGDEMRELRENGYKVHPQAKFHLLRTKISNVAPSYAALGLLSPILGIPLRRDFLLPDGSDGVVDFPSQGAGTLAPEFPGVISHAGIGGNLIFGTERSQTEDPLIGAQVSKLLLAPDSPGFDFYPFPQGIAPTSQANIDAIIQAWQLADFLISKYIRIPVSASAASGEEYEYVLSPPTNEPLFGEVTWVVQVFGPEGETSEGASCIVDPADSRIVKVKIDPQTVGEVVLYATYVSQNDKLIVAHPVLVASQYGGAALSGIEVGPSVASLSVGDKFSPQLWGRYSDGSRSQLFIPVEAANVFSSSVPSVVDTEASGGVAALAPGTATITASFAGFQATAEYRVFAAGTLAFLNSTGANFSGVGGAGTFDLSAPDGSNWTAVPSAAWITIDSPLSGAGSGSIRFAVAPNTGPPRTGTIGVFGFTYTIAQAQAPAFTVTHTGDSGPGSLREAIANAAPGDDIEFASGLSGTIALLSPLVASKNLSIRGPSADKLTISGNGSTRILEVSAGATVVVSGVSLIEGVSAGDPLNSVFGGAIANNGVLTLIDCVLRSNEAGPVAGGINGGSGGAIANRGILTVTRCQFLENAVGNGDGGAIYSAEGAVATIADSTFTDNAAINHVFNGIGGAIASYGRLTLSGCTFTGNTSVRGGAILSNSPLPLSIANCTFTGNSLTKGGSGAGVHHENTGAVTITDCVFTDNEAAGVNGSAVTASSAGVIERCVFTANRCGGGALSVSSDGQLEVVDTKITDNTVGGGLSNSGAATLRRCDISRNTYMLPSGSVVGTGGGGIRNSGTLTLEGCSVCENITDGTGGGIRNGAALTMVNCTIAGNTGTNGGGLYSFDEPLAEVSLSSCTIYGNRALYAPAGFPSGGGGILTNTPNITALRLGNSIVAGNSVAGTTFSADIAGVVRSENFNCIQQIGGVTFLGSTNRNLTGIDPQLEWRTTATGALVLVPGAGSPVVDAGDAPSLNTDQRGMLRPVLIPGRPRPGNGADMGACELDGNTTSAGMLSFSRSEYHAGEGSTQAVIEVARENGSKGAVSVTIMPFNGSAIAGVDFGNVTPTLSWADGETGNKSVSIPLVDDELVETDEAFTVFLSNGTGGAALGPGPTEAEVQIVEPLWVTNLNNSGPGSLRQIVVDAPLVGGVVRFAPAVRGTITLTSGEIKLPPSITLQGPGADLLTISGNNQSRIMQAVTWTRVSGLTFTKGRDLAFGGAAFYIYAEFVAEACRFTDHLSKLGGALGGGGTYGVIRLTDCTFSGNRSTSGGGALLARELQATRCLFTGNEAENSGGAVSAVKGTMTECTLSDNLVYSSDGGGAYLGGGDADAFFTVSRCAIMNNTAPSGAGISAVGKVLIVDSTLAGNQAVGGSSSNDGDAGGVYAFGIASNTTTLRGSTLSGNAAARFGGGVVFANSSGQIEQCTVTGNTAAKGGGIAALSSNTPLNLRGSLIAENTAAEGPDLYGAYMSGDYNLIQTAGGYTMDGETTHHITGRAPLLGPLQNNGGPTFTHALLPGSPALDAGLNGAATTDQRGEARVFNIPRYANAGDGSDIGAFELETVPPNVAPTISAIFGQTLLEDEAKTVSFQIGDVETAVENLVVTAQSANSALVPAGGLVLGGTGETRTLLLTPAANHFGTALITVFVDDGEDVRSSSFVLTVNSENDVPALSSIGNVTINEDTATDALPFTVGDVETLAENLSLTSESSNLTLVPADRITFAGTGASRSITVMPAANQSGSAIITVTVSDGQVSMSKFFTLTVNPVNDAPAFVKGPNQKVARTDSARSIAAWATNLSPGPANESAQAVTFLVENDHPEIFSAPPGISADGTLTFAPKATGSGIATVTVRLQDNGGTANGGMDTSAAQTFTITVGSVVEEAGQYDGLSLPAAGGPLANERLGRLRVNVTKTGAFSGRLTLGGRGYPLSGAIQPLGTAQFGRKRLSPLTLRPPGQPALLLSIELDTTDGTDTLTGTLTQNGVGFADLRARRLLYTSAARPVPPMRHVPSEWLGNYTAIFEAKTPAEQNRAASEFPQGNGYGRITITRKGYAVLTGRLADGQAVSCTNSLSLSGEWAFYAPLYAKAGAVGGYTRLDDVPDQSDLDGIGLHWFKPAKPADQRYPLGWPGGIQVDLFGAKYVAPLKNSGENALPGLTAPDGNGNAEIVFMNGNIPDPGVTRAANLGPDHQFVLVNPLPPTQWSFSLKPKTGEFTSSFIHPADGKKVRANGVILQKQKRGTGYFLSLTESGSVTIQPQQ